MSSDFIQFMILYVLYDKYDSGLRNWIKARELLDSSELDYLDGNIVATEIDFLAGKNLSQEHHYKLGQILRD